MEVAHDVVSTATIADLVTECERMAATNRALFEVLGAWVADEPDPSAQQWFAVACHRHAWHADLWEARRPTVPIESADSGGETTASADAVDRVAWYAAELKTLKAVLEALADRVDPVLDPSTQRVIQLVRADLDELAAAAPDD